VGSTVSRRELGEKSAARCYLFQSFFKIIFMSKLKYPTLTIISLPYFSKQTLLNPQANTGPVDCERIGRKSRKGKGFKVRLFLCSQFFIILKKSNHQLLIMHTFTKTTPPQAQSSTREGGWKGWTVTTQKFTERRSVSGASFLCSQFFILHTQKI